MTPLRAAQVNRTVALMLDIALAPMLLFAIVWVHRRQATILREGIALTHEQRDLARVLGVTAVERVRVMSARVVPMPLPDFARHVAESAGWISPHIVGMTLGHGIVLHDECCGDRQLLAHELKHVHQSARLGGLAPFLRHYLRESMWPGYPHGPLEMEASAAEIRGSTAGQDVIPYVPSVVA